MYIFRKVKIRRFHKSLHCVLCSVCVLLVLTSENVIEMQRNQADEAEQQVELLQEELRKKESEYEQEIQELRQRQTSKLR